jgi:hypothetical protein
MDIQTASLPGETVRAEYQRRLKERRATQALYDRRHRLLGNVRVALFLLALLMAGLAFGKSLFSAWWLLLPLLLFLAVTVVHDRVIQKLRRARRATGFYETGLLRLEGRWSGQGTTGSRFRRPTHPYAEDLDLFGNASLFQRLCSTRTRSGEERLADWLCRPAAPNVVRARQKAVAELESQLDLREDLVLLGEETREAADSEGLSTWGKETIGSTARSLRIIALFLTLLTVAPLIYWLRGNTSLPLLICVLIGQSFAATQRKSVKRVTHNLDKSANDLAMLASLLKRLEQTSFEAPLLQDLGAGLSDGGALPSVRIAKLQTLVAWRDAMRSDLLAILGLALLWPLHIAFALETWRVENGALIASWLEAIGEFEALTALAAYAHENPDYPFPEIVESEICFEAEGMAHPLLPAEGAITNDIRIGPEARLFLVSGSNMSGKSTLLRTIGINTVLALAGAPVRATRMWVSPLHIGASLRTQDSLQAGVSRFYAEITRLHQIVDIGRTSPPLLFLLDEILHGTNSHDRLVGAEAVVRALVKEGAIGLVTTHDLALVRIAEDKSLAAVNVHFEDDMVEGKMHFDYHLRPGVVEKSNAIALMRAVGLEV